ncbi:MAG: 30S ribosomal protein S12 methylthiotransferase RimO [Kiritimatiellaeota bacterium]|nr:30S ribosomal protein S12 methylthiotransferase RimO [Kiritimatiellota bacterium]
MDAEVLCGALALDGALVGADLRAADIVLINTCAFIAPAREEAAREIRRALRWKRSGERGRRVVVAGCLPQLDAAAARREYPEVDLFLGVDDIPEAAGRIVALVREGACPSTAPDRRLSTPKYLYDHTAPRLLTTPPSYAYVKIADGCDHFCRFCTIPRIRGRHRSRRPESVVAECRDLLGAGVGELVLTAQDTTRYGRDLADVGTLADLLRRCDALAGEFWIRLLYTHPRHFTPELSAVFAEGSHLVKYIDIPLQHISDRILRRMGRGLGENETRELMKRLRQEVPGLAVRTTLLVGYPGETDDDFRRLLEFVEEYRFDRLGVFGFSPEPGTPAAALRDEFVPPPVIRERCDAVMALQQQVSLERNRALIGTRQRVLIDAGAGRDWVGRTWADAPEIDNIVRVRSPQPLASGQFLDVRIIAAEAYELEGVPVCPAPESAD